MSRRQRIQETLSIRHLVRRATTRLLWVAAIITAAIAGVLVIGGAAEAAPAIIVLFAVAALAAIASFGITVFVPRRRYSPGPTARSELRNRVGQASAASLGDAASGDG
jgi:hypothetical protein